MDLVKYEMEVPKESKEIVDSVVALVDHFMQKKPLAEISLLLPGIMTAFDGYDKVKEEIASNNRDELVAYLINKLLPIILPVKANEPQA